MASEAVVVAAETAVDRDEVVEAAEIAAAAADTVVDVDETAAAVEVATVVAEAAGASAAVATEVGHPTGRRHWAAVRGRSRAKLQR